MPSDDESFSWDDHFGEEGEYDWDAVEGIQVYFDSDGGVDVHMTIDGELVDFGTFDSEEAQEFIWGELWYWAQDNDIEFDKEEDY